MKCTPTGQGFVCGPRRRESKGKKEQPYLSKKQSAAAKELYEPTLPPLDVGKVFVVVGYHTGTFVGEVVQNNGSTMNPRITFKVVDAMREGPFIEQRCSFPECTLEEEHGGDHVFGDLRNGVMLEIHPGLIRWKYPRLESSTISIDVLPDTKKDVYTRAEFERDRFGEGGGK